MILMRLLKLLLWMTLIVCTAWGGAIVFGPAIITRAVSTAIGGTVEIRRLNVSPKLQVTASVIEFELDTPHNIPLRGMVRGFDLGWQFKDEFAIVAKVGPTRVEDIGSVKSAQFKFVPTSLFDWSSAETAGTLSTVNHEQIDIETVTIEAILGDTFNSLKAVDLTLDNASVDILAMRAEKLKIETRDVELDTSILTQEIPFKLSNLGPLGSDFWSIEGLAVDGNFQDGLLEFDAAAKRAEFMSGDVSIDELSMSSKYNLVTKKFGPQAQVAAKQITAQSPEMRITEYTGDVTLNDTSLMQTGRMTVETLALKSGATFLAEIADAGLKYEVSLPTNVDREFSVSAGAKLQISPDLLVSSVLDMTISQLNLPDCCTLRDSSVRYLIEVPGAKLTGASSCDDGFCEIDKMRHSLKTDDTDIFFEKLAEEKVLSPLVLPLAYYAMREGIPNGSGHSLNF